ncbi:MAG: acyltransferase family protein [Enterobacteriaceae bacterium]|nr:acyltransferase family protein [Enterobacteriaceae bacterium]
MQLDSIRGIACLIVVFSHLSLVFFPQLHLFSVDKNVPKSNILQYIHELPFGFLYSGTAAVYCFFTLSGYVLARSFLRKEIKWETLLLSIIKRYPRLAIPSTVSCLLACLFMLFGSCK